MHDTRQLSVAETLEKASTETVRRRRRIWIAAGLALIVAALLGAARLLQRPTATVGFRTEPVRQGELVVTVTATGNLAATNQVDVGSELSGTVTRVTADFNASVTAGHPLAYLDDSRYRAAVTKSRAEVTAAQANHREAQVTRERAAKSLARHRLTRTLTDGQLPALETLEQAEADLERADAAIDAAAAAIESARATLSANETDLNKTVIHSPIQGVVLHRAIEPGQTVAASLSAPVLFTLAEDLKRMELQVDVDEADVGQVRDGQSATFTVDAYPDRRFNARITQVRYGAEITDGVVTYKAVMAVDNPDLLLRPGMTATAEIVVERIEQALLVPNSALRFTPSIVTNAAAEHRGFLSRLMPGPPHRTTRRRPAADTAGDAEVSGRVWVLDNGAPIAVAVRKGPSDGVSTAVLSPDLVPGTPLIVTTVTER